MNSINSSPTKKTGPLTKSLSKYKKELKSRSLSLPLSAWLIVFYIFVGNLAFNVAYSTAFYLLSSQDDCFSADGATTSQAGASIVPGYVVFTIVNAMLFWMYPLAGWLADTTIGYDMSVTVSIFLCWFGLLAQCMNFSIQYAYGQCHVPNQFKYAVSVFTLIPLSFGATGLYTVLPAYGLCQLADHSSSSIRAFIHWFVMGTFLASLSGMFVSSITASLICCGVGAITSTVAICCHIRFYNHKFEKVGVQSKNPYKTVVNVLKFACTNSKIQNRSALTYWEDEMPSRIDLAKTKYGGPYEVKDVEDVKRFWRILGVVFSTFGFYISYYITVYNSSMFASEGFGFMMWNLFQNTIITIIPVFELIVIPCFPKVEYFLLSPLKGIGFAYILNIITLILMMINFFTQNVSQRYFIAPFICSGLVHGFGYIYGIQFICSQSPSNMTGMLFGIYWFFHAFMTNIGCIFFKLDHLLKYILVTFLTISCLGLSVFIGVAQWYKRRMHEPVYNPYSNIAYIYTKEYEEHPPTPRPP